MNPAISELSEEPTASLRAFVSPDAVLEPQPSESSDPSKKDWVKFLEEATPEQWAEARKAAEEKLIRRAGKTVQVFPVND